MTGYELKGHLDTSTQGIWHASLSQIYPTLQKMAHQDWVTVTEVPQTGKPDRKVYRITPSGQASLLSWLTEGQHTVARHKNINVLKLFFAGSLPKKRILHQLQTELDLQRQQLATYEQRAKATIEGVVAATGLQREAVLWDAVRQLGIESTKTTIRWLEATIKRIEEEYDE